MTNNIRCLKHFKSWEELEKEFKITQTWKILDFPIERRSAKLLEKKYDFHEKLRKLSIKNDIAADDDEIVTWIDSLSILNKTFVLIKDEKVKSRIDILMEYLIHFCNGQRADYLLISENKILILEFTFLNYSSERRFENKVSQAMQYKELLSNQLSKNISISTYVVMYKHEMNEESKEWNSKQIRDLGNFIEFYFHENGAITELMNLENNRL